jgi:hypothetical protein
MNRRCRPTLCDDPDDRPEAIFGGETTLPAGGENLSTEDKRFYSPLSSSFQKHSLPQILKRMYITIGI